MRQWGVNYVRSEPLMIHLSASRLLQAAFLLIALPTVLCNALSAQFATVLSIMRSGLISSVPATVPHAASHDAVSHNTPYNGLLWGPRCHTQ